MKLEMKEKTVIEPIAKNEYIQCNSCNEFFNSGFYLDDIFYCKSCTIKDFKEYLDLRKECDK